MIIKPTMLIVGDKDHGVLPIGSVPDGVDYSRDVRLPPLNVAGRMLTIRSVNQGHLRQWRGPGRSRRDSEELL